MWIGAGVFTESLPATVEARFDNLVIQRMAPGAVAAGEPPAEPPPAGPRATQPAGSGDILLSDTMDDPARGVMSEVSPSPSRSRYAYIGGEFSVQKIDPAWEGFPIAGLPSEFSDASLAVDARLVGEVRGRFVALACRHDAATGAGYRFYVGLEAGTFVLERVDQSGGETLARGPSRAIQTGNATNRLELGCAGSTISASVNGTQVASVQDSRYQRGRMWIGVGVDRDALPATAEIRLDNLVVRRLASGAAVTKDAAEEYGGPGGVWFASPGAGDSGWNGDAERVREAP